MLDLRRLLVFREVARLASFTAAAEVLHYSQSAVSHHVSRLEIESGAKLFERKPGGRAILTTAGRALLARADRLLREEVRRDLPALLDPAGTAADYVAAQQKRASLVRTWRAVFAEHQLDAVAEPCSTGEIWKRHESVRDQSRPPRLYSMWSDTNFPVVALPAGFSPVDNGPVGMQLVGLPHTDRLILGLVTDYQTVTGYHLAVPPSLDDPEPADFSWPERPLADSQPPAYAAPHSPFDILHQEA